MLARKDSLGVDAEVDSIVTSSLGSEEESDVEAQLEEFMRQAFVSQPEIPKGESQSSLDDVLRMRRGKTKKALKLPKIDIFSAQNEFDPVFRVNKAPKRAQAEPASASEVAEPAQENYDSELDSVSLGTAQEEKVAAVASSSHD